jgi:hypothetical protein
VTSPYPGYDPLAEADHWDERTRAVVVDRVQRPPGYRFFDEGEVAVLEAACDRVLPQDDRPPEARVPMGPFIDKMLWDDSTDGFRTPDVPWPQELWRSGVRGLDEAAHARYRRSFTALDPAERDMVLRAVEGGDVSGGAWDHVPPSKFFSSLVEQCIAAYYAHPTAWAEIGWAGPASPRGYVRTGYGMRDPWEPREQRQASSVELVRRREEGQASPSGSGGATH